MGGATQLRPDAFTDGSDGASWGPDGTIVYSARTKGLWRVSADGGTPKSFSTPDPQKGEYGYVLPQILPGGGTVLFTVTHTPLPTWGDTEIVAQSLATGDRIMLVPGAADGRYVASGHLLYLRQGTLMAAPFDAQRLTVTGGAVALISDGAGVSYLDHARAPEIICRQIRIGSGRHAKTVRPARRRRDAQRSGTRYRLRVVTTFENA